MYVLSPFVGPLLILYTLKNPAGRARKGRNNWGEEGISSFSSQSTVWWGIFLDRLNSSSFLYVWISTGLPQVIYSSPSPSPFTQFLIVIISLRNESLLSWSVDRLLDASPVCDVLGAGPMVITEADPETLQRKVCVDALCHYVPSLRWLNTCSWWIALPLVAIESVNHWWGYCRSNFRHKLSLSTALAAC